MYTVGPGRDNRGSRDYIDARCKVLAPVAPPPLRLARAARQLSGPVTLRRQTRGSTADSPQQASGKSHRRFASYGEATTAERSSERARRSWARRGGTQGSGSMRVCLHRTWRRGMGGGWGCSGAVSPAPEWWNGGGAVRTRKRQDGMLGGRSEGFSDGRAGGGFAREPQPFFGVEPSQATAHGTRALATTTSRPSDSTASVARRRTLSSGPDPAAASPSSAARRRRAPLPMHPAIDSQPLAGQPRVSPPALRPQTKHVRARNTAAGGVIVVSSTRLETWAGSGRATARSRIS
jgi:hypothetical protein